MEDLIISAKQGNNEALSELISLIKDDLSRIAISRMHNIEDANDVIQDTLLTLYLKIHTLDDIQHFKSWIITILINKCNDFYASKNKYVRLIEKCSKHLDTITYTEDIIDFDNMIKILNENYQQIFKLYYEDNYTTSDIAKILNMNESTVRANLSKGRQKIHHKYKSVTFIIFFICLAILTTVGAITLISYIKGLFETSSIGEENSGVLNAIENLDWYQKLDMDYIDLGNGNKIKAEYVLLDEMNLYIIFDYTSQSDISKFSDITLADLKITDENGNVICDNDNVFLEQYAKYIGNKTIENDKQHIKFLIYIYSNSFPTSKTLNMDFSRIALSKKGIFNNKYSEINTNANFSINLNEKFQNRNFTTYISNDSEIKKSIITDTGFYAIMKIDNFEKVKINLLDEQNNNYDCYYHPIVSEVPNTHIIMITSIFNNCTNETIRIIIGDNEYVLMKQ